MIIMEVHNLQIKTSVPNETKCCCRGKLKDGVSVIEHLEIKAADQKTNNQHWRQQNLTRIYAFGSSFVQVSCYQKIDLYILDMK